MHRLTISDEVFSRLRALRQRGGQSEDQILRRLLGFQATPGAGNPAGSGPSRRPEGIEDATYGIFFAEGFEIFRTYKGRPYTARVVGGRWRLDGDSLNPDSRGHDSLNQLSQAVIDGNENAWMFWFFKAPDGTPKRIAELRDPELVQKRPRKSPGKRRPTPVQTAAVISAPVSFSTPAHISTPAFLSTDVEVATPVIATTRPPASPLPQPGRGGKPWEPAT